MDNMTKMEELRGEVIDRLKSEITSGSLSTTTVESLSGLLRTVTCCINDDREYQKEK